MSEQTTSQIEMSIRAPIRVRDLGSLRYNDALIVQLTEHDQVVNGGDPVILLVEHPSVLTLGKNADPSFLLQSTASFASRGVEVVETDRGGEVTAHVPGQLVVYPIIPVSRMGLTPRKYVHLLEEAVILTLAEFGIEATRDEEHPGVWIGTNKICAIGVRIHKRVAMHGLALNVSNSLELFQQIVPCGIRLRGVTTVSLQKNEVITMSTVKDALVSQLQILLARSTRC